MTGKRDIKQVATTGGMPSSHSTAVSSLATYIVTNKGSHHMEVAHAIILSMVVMYDAQGIRRHTGEIAQLVNDL
ncbi:divergent PAP2 family protein [Pseudalkalibacillus sp. A8]|uniref:divergent PAP2 family protein n=1 Tax=Pseudalkalibacillus sp. A8 TaxID=3382641 RepID=UPI0038B4CC6F